MSTKTIKQRIALVAVSALTAGFLSVAVTPSANALVTTSYDDHLIVLATTADGNGTVETNISPENNQTFSQIGWVADTRATSLTTTGGVYSASVGSTGQALAGARVAFFATGNSVTTTNGMSVVVTGGTLSGLSATGGGAVLAFAATAGTYSQLNSTATVYTQDTTPTGTLPVSTGVATGKAGNAVAGVFTVNAAVGSTATISVFSGSLITNLDTATNGTLVASWSISIVASSGVGTYAASQSDIFQQACMNNATTGTSGTSIFDTTSACANGQVGVVYLDLDDANGQNVTSGTVTASASAGNITASGTTTTGSIIAAATSGFATITDDANGQLWFYVAQPTAGTAGTSVVTITLNGAVISTKSIRWNGDIATLAILPASASSFSVGQSTDTSEGNIGGAGVVYTARDAAGTALTLTSHPVVSTATGALVGATLSATTSQTAYAAYQTSSRGFGYSTLLVPANSLSGSSTYSLRITNGAGATITSNIATVTVSRGATNSFDASWDKASYSTGDVATLTITLKDAFGNLMATGTPLTGLSLDTNTAGLTLFVGTPCVATSTVTTGVRTCKYSVLNTAGSYAYSFDVDTATPQSATIGVVSVKASTEAVSNADVLKSIVALIASINKQIQALQKLILKR